jgi:alpha-tubulin suppressor-like RCC1 family protein
MIIRPSFLRILLSVFAFLALGLPILFRPRLSSSNGATAIASGFNHSCALVNGGVKCWGENDSGQLGDGTTDNRSTPVDVKGLTSDIQAISVDGDDHTCALTSGGGVKCWGSNTYGQLGDGTIINHHIPVDVSGLTSGIAFVSARGRHTCAVTTGGGVKCWGWNLYGQIGDGTNTDRHAPVDVSGLTAGISTLSLGTYNTCALTTQGGLKCWGANSYGELGDGTTTDRNIPVDVSSLSTGVKSVSFGQGPHLCVLTTANGVKCWGRNSFGELGNAGSDDSPTPVDVSGLTTGAAQVVVGWSNACALTTGGGVKCWGHNGWGELGDGTNTNSSIPVDVIGLASGIQALSAGGIHNCALTTAGGVKCWGDNDDGQLGDGTETDSNTPVNVITLTFLNYGYLPLVQNLNTPVPPTPTLTPTITNTPGPTTPTRSPTPNTGPKAGGWQVSSSSVPIYSSTSGFRVSGSSITQFGVWIYPPANPCSFLALHSTSTSISGSSFSFSDWSGNFTVSGSFSSSTSASGSIHIYYNSFPSGCSLSSQTYNGTWTATWTGN